jgi:hypothetical protein
MIYTLSWKAKLPENITAKVGDTLPCPHQRRPTDQAKRESQKDLIIQFGIY